MLTPGSAVVGGSGSWRATLAAMSFTSVSASDGVQRCAFSISNAARMASPLMPRRRMEPASGMRLGVTSALRYRRPARRGRRRGRRLHGLDGLAVLALQLVQFGAQRHELLFGDEPQVNVRRSERRAGAVPRVRLPGVLVEVEAGELLACAEDLDVRQFRHGGQPVPHASSASGSARQCDRSARTSDTVRCAWARCRAAPARAPRSARRDSSSSRRCRSLPRCGTGCRGRPAASVLGSLARTDSAATRQGPRRVASAAIPAARSRSRSLQRSLQCLQSAVLQCPWFLVRVGRACNAAYPIVPAYIGMSSVSSSTLAASVRGAGAGCGARFLGRLAQRRANTSGDLAAKKSRTRST